MFGFFKHTVTPIEFGQAILQLTGGWLSTDAGRSLGMRFSNWDGSQGWPIFLEGQGLPNSVQRRYSCLFGHCAIQAACTQFDSITGRLVTLGAMENLTKVPEGYNAEETYADLERVYRGQYKFAPTIQSLKNPEFQIRFLPNTDVGVLNAKFLLERFVVPDMKNNHDFIAEFDSYSSAVGGSIGTVCRAINQLLNSVRLGSSVAA